MNLSKVLEYVKQYLVIAICVIVIIGALVGLPMVSAGWNEDVQKSIKPPSLFCPQPRGVPPPGAGFCLASRQQFEML